MPFEYCHPEDGALQSVAVQSAVFPPPPGLVVITYRLNADTGEATVIRSQRRRGAAYLGGTLGQGRPD
jgi:hypothetical protein